MASDNNTRQRLVNNSPSLNPLFFRALYSDMAIHRLVVIIEWGMN